MPGSPIDPVGLPRTHIERDPVGGKTWAVNETIEPKANRLVYFDATLTHRVQPYEGNRVSISWVWWKTVPDRYDPVVLTNTSYHVLERVWT